MILAASTEPPILIGAAGLGSTFATGAGGGGTTISDPRPAIAPAGPVPATPVATTGPLTDISTTGSGERSMPTGIRDGAVKALGCATTTPALEDATCEAMIFTASNRGSGGSGSGNEIGPDRLNLKQRHQDNRTHHRALQGKRDHKGPRLSVRCNYALLKHDTASDTANFITVPSRLHTITSCHR